MKRFLEKFSTNQKIIGGVALVAGIAGTLYYFGFFNKSEAINLVPKDALFVGVINVADLADKADLEDLKQTESYEKLMELSEESDFMNDFMENPASTGIDLTTDIFVFAMEREVPFVAFTMDVDDQEEFESFLKNLNDETAFIDDDFNIEEGEGYSYLLLEKRSDEYAYYNYQNRRNQDIFYKGILAWDDEKILLLSSDDRLGENDLTDVISELWEQNDADRITSSETFMDFYSEKQDISVWVNIPELADMSRDRDIREFSRYFGDITASYHMNFEDDGISVQMDMAMDPEDASDYDNSLNYIFHKLDEVVQDNL